MEPMFKISKYGRTVNLRNKTAHDELIEYKRRNGEHSQFPLGDDAFLDFEIYMSQKYRAEFRSYVVLCGGLRIAAQTFKAASMPSKLIEYWLKVKEDEANGKTAVSSSGRLEESTPYSA